MNLDELQIQLGKETVWGTGVAGSVKAMGVLSAEQTPQIPAKEYPDLRGTLDPGYIAAVQSVGGGMTIEQVALYEDICYALEGLFGEDATPTGTGPYVRDYAGVNTSAARIMTAYYGKAGYAYRLVGGLVNALTLRGEAGENDTELMTSYEMLGKEVEEDASLASLSDRTVNPIMAHHGAVYIDAWAGTIGTTLLDTAAFAFELGLNRNRILKRYIGSLTAGDHEAKRAEADGNTLKLSMEVKAASKAFLDAVLNSGTGGVFQRQVRLKFTSGANIAQFDFAGFSKEAPRIYDNRDGIVSIEMTLHALYNSALANWFKAQITNSLATLP